MAPSGSRDLTAARVAWDAWRATRSDSTAIVARQTARLEVLIRHARRNSRFYAEHYRAVPPGPIGLEEFYQLPPVTKPELMARFDDWVTDPNVTQAGVEQFVADLHNLGQDFLNQYVVFHYLRIDRRTGPDRPGSPCGRRNDRTELRARSWRPHPWTPRLGC